MKTPKKTYTPEQYRAMSGTVALIALFFAALVLFTVGVGQMLALAGMFFLGVMGGTLATKAEMRRDMDEAIFPGWQTYDKWIENERQVPKRTDYVQ